MEKFIIEGGLKLTGEVTPAGNKNAALPLLAASLLTDEPIIFRNIPRIRDVETMCLLMESLGVEITALEPHVWRVQAKEVHPADLNPDICRKIRASASSSGADSRCPPARADLAAVRAALRS